MDKPRVLVLFCGGTLVMETNERGALHMSPKERAIAILLGMEPKLHDLVDLEIEYIVNIDSTNMNPAYWERMADVIAAAYDDYDGFVITHGTDTMAYTASALSFALRNLGKPVILTGAQISGARIESDARRNFVNAVRVAILDLAGVYIVFDEEIILGARASKVSESKLDAFETMNWHLAGEIRIDIRLSDEVRKRHNGLLEVMKGFETDISVNTLFPGLQASVLERILDSGVKGMVLRAFGSGNIPSQYLDLLRRARDKRVPVVVDTQCREGATSMHLYDVGAQALDLGVIQAYDMSIETVITKLMWALAHVPYEEIAEVMHTDFVGEINKEGKIY
jgi:L-asparaginase